VTAFPAIVLEAFRAKKEVEVETSSERGTAHRVTIWIVVVDGVPYVRSVRGPKGRWFRELAARPGAIHVGQRRIPVRAGLVRDDLMNQRISHAFQAKYDRPSASVAAMVRPEVLATTARLEPA